MAIRTYAEQLEAVQAAIACLEAGDGIQSYSIKDRSYTYADLDTLYKREERLMVLAKKEARGGIRVRYLVPE